MKPYLTDIPVALVFFNRPDTFAKVFASIAEARPSRLFLIQDGARKEKEGEFAKVLECRELIKIDWECKVYEDFADYNMGCGLRIYTGISNAFNYVDRLVIVEDDIVVGEDMLPFCAEVLERYKNDERIGLISGMNHVGIYERTENSYIFSSRGGAIWGWATWKRVWECVDWNLECANDSYLMDSLSSLTLPQIDGKSIASRTIAKHKSVVNGERQTSWTTQFIVSSCILQNRMYIVPSKNLTSNIGLMGEHSNSCSIYTVPRALRRIYFAPTYKLDRPLIHPQYVIDDVIYSSMQRKIMQGNFLSRYLRPLESLLYRIIPYLGKL